MNKIVGGSSSNCCAYDTGGSMTRRQRIGVLASAVAWAVNVYSCWYLFKATSIYPSAVSCWCPSGLWGSSHIETLVYRYQFVPFGMLIALLWAVRRVGSPWYTITRWALVINVAFWFVALIILQVPWRWFI